MLYKFRYNNGTTRIRSFYLKEDAAEFAHNEGDQLVEGGETIDGTDARLITRSRGQG